MMKLRIFAVIGLLTVLAACDSESEAKQKFINKCTPDKAKFTEDTMSHYKAQEEHCTCLFEQLKPKYGASKIVYLQEHPEDSKYSQFLTDIYHATMACVRD